MAPPSALSSGAVPAARLVYDLENGLAVRAQGKLEVYAPSGTYSLIISKIAPDGIGPLELAYRQLSEKLEAEGLFSPDRKRPLPPFPRRIVVVTSPTGAALHDFLQIAGRRWPATEILIAPSRVQGDGAETELVKALQTANQVDHADLVVLTRGGGSLEDLWPFNSEKLARAIAASTLPVVSAVGHEVDFTIADRVADLRAATPSEAAEVCLPDRRQLQDTLDRLTRRLHPAGHRYMVAARSALDHLDHRLHQAGRRELSHAHHRLQSTTDRLNHALRDYLQRKHHDLLRRAAQLEALSPLAVLVRGYSITQQDDKTRTILRDAANVQPGDLIHSQLAHGKITSRVVSVTLPLTPPS